MNAEVNAIPMSNASARLIDGKFQIRTKKYTAPAIVEALDTRNAIYINATPRTYHPGIRSIIHYPSTYLSNSLDYQ
jgi:hypothetical protein